MSNVEAEDRKDTLVQRQGGGTVVKRLISLLAAATAVVMLAPPGFAQSTYTWKANCSNGVAGAVVAWHWLHDGVIISNTFPPNVEGSCNASGSGEIPASINGIQVNGIYVVLVVSDSAGCSGDASVTTSFDPLDPQISIHANAAVSKQSGFGSKCGSPHASISFDLSTP